MKLYLAGSFPMKQEGIYEQIRSGNMNFLGSFYYADKTMEEMLPLFKNFLCDSGAFTFFTAGKHVDWIDYIKRFADFINRNNIKHFFELDIDSLVGYERVIYLRKQLEDMTGKPVIPVWHKSRGKEKFLEMCEEYDYVAIGGIVSNEIKRNEYPAFTHLIAEAHKRNARIHGLGFTNLLGLEKYHFDSVDSTAWLSGNRFGSLYKFNGRTMVKEQVPPGYRLANSGREARAHNLGEWLKFSDYADRKL
jgi:hypothetical protein